MDSSQNSDVSKFISITLILEHCLQQEMCKHEMNTAASFCRKQRDLCVILAAQHRSANINKAALQV